MIDIFTASLADLLPQNISHAPNIPPVISALDPQLQLLSQQSLSPRLISDLDNSPSIALDHIAMTLASDLYGYATDDNSRREILKASIIRHMHKGTPAEIIRALKLMGVDAKFIPWWEFNGQPYTFKIVADITGNYYRGKNITEIITRIVNESKAARSLMTNLQTNLTLSENSHLFAGIIRSLSGHEKILLPIPQSPPQNLIHHGIISHSHGQKIIPIHHERFFAAYPKIGVVHLSSGSANIGVELSIMQELLLQFEKRIFSRIDDMEKNINAEFDGRIKSLDNKIDSVIELLRWKGDDETL